jgi:hypothetical protein
MKCPKCQTENRDGIKFCEDCGNKLEIKCPSCGVLIPHGKNFCGECGHNLQGPKEPPDYSKPQSYTPRFLADKILTFRSSIEGERKLVTVFFADVANFTTLSEKLDPEEVHQLDEKIVNHLWTNAGVSNGTRGGMGLTQETGCISG